ncbi:MAG: hydrogenase 4 subunit F [Chloroflexi bacterium]|nr:hydrogenase 4 subunit F [Chloroflexota bacterium]
MADALAIALLLMPVLTGLLCLTTRHTPRPAAINVVGALATLALGLAVAMTAFEAPHEGWGGLLYLDALSGLMLVVITIVSSGAALYSVGYMARAAAHGALPAHQIGWYYLYFHLFVATMIGVVLANNLGIAWAFIEATTIVSALLVGFYQSEAALEAAWKYLIICTVGITCALFGLILLYFAAGQTLGPVETALHWTELRRVAGQLDPGLVRLAFIFVLVGYGTKAGFAPLHTWLPDAHSQAPAPVSAVLSGVLLSCALYAILRVTTIATASAGASFTGGLLLAFGLVSLAVATPFILVQHDVKRLLAYSSVEHIGLIAIAVGLGGRLALYGGALHLLNHAIAKAMLFFTAGNLDQRYGTRQIARIRGAARLMPWTGPALLVGCFAITGTPPLGLFVSEFAIFSGAFGQGHLLVLLAVILAIAVIFAGMLYHTGGMALGAPPARLKAGEAGRLDAWLLAVPALALLALGLLVPPPLSAALDQVVAVLRGQP